MKNRFESLIGNGSKEYLLEKERYLMQKHFETLNDFCKVLQEDRIKMQEANDYLLKTVEEYKTHNVLIGLEIHNERRKCAELARECAEDKYTPEEIETAIKGRKSE